MVTTRLSPQKKANARGPMVLLSAAICEWFLIFLLFLDATFSYILRRFAEYCELPTPCLFCSRINAPFGKRKFEGYNALLCRGHREEISSFVCCHVHGNFIDVREMCEECFIPFSVDARLNPSSNTVGQLWSDVEQRSVQQSLPTSSGPRNCPCCKKSFGSKPIARRFLKSTPASFGASVAIKPPLPQAPGRSRFSGKNTFKKLRNRVSAPATPQPDGKSRSDALSYVGYKELQYTSDSEAELRISDEEEAVLGARVRNDMISKLDPHYVTKKLLKLQAKDSLLEKKGNQSVADATSVLDQPTQLETQESSLPTHGLEGLNWDQLHVRTKSHVSQELDLLDNVAKHLSKVSGDDSLSVEPQPQDSSSAMLAEPITLSNSPLCIEDKNQETLKSKDEDDITIGGEPINTTGHSGGGVSCVVNGISATSSSAPTNEKVGSTKSIDRPSSGGSTKFEDIKSVSKQSAPEEADSQKEISTSSVKLPSASGSTEFEEIKSVIEQSPRKQDDSQTVVFSSSYHNHVQAVASLERNDSSLKYSERVSLVEVEGESSVDTLKREIEHVKKCMNDLYKELEEERNASAVAANQAMAMITRLQEEKAALHMEASQYLRMMDEQAEYDTEALQRANDLLAEKEKELQDLEYELESYRNNSHGGPAGSDPHYESSSTTDEKEKDLEDLEYELESYRKNMHGESPVIGPHIGSSSTMAEKEKELQDLEYELESYRNNMHGGPPVIDPHNDSISTLEQNTTGDYSVRLNESSLCEPSSPECSRMAIVDDISGYAQSTMSNLEEQKHCLEDYLNKLEIRIRVASCNNTPRAGYNSSRHLDLDPNKLEFQEISLTNDEDDSENEEDGTTLRNWLGVVDRDSEDSPTYLLDDSNEYSEESSHNRSNWQHLSIPGLEPNMETFEHEIAHFKARLRAFEGDWQSIKHSLINFKTEVKGWNIFNRQ